MAGRDVYEEKIRLYVEASGDAELQSLVKSFGDLGDTADFQSNLARKAMERFAGSVDAISKVKAFDQLKRDLVETEQKLGEAQAGAQALFREFNSGDTSSAKVAALQRQAKQAVNELSASADGQRLALQGLRRELASSGVDTRQLGTAQGALKAQMAEARTALVNAGQSVKQYRAESARAAAQVPADNREIAQSYTLVERGIGRLRGLIAGAGAYLGFREAAQGIKNLAEVAQQAENARRALQNLYGSQAEGNRAYDALRTLSKENGIAFDVLVESAKKLKAFGLDPLNGSMQALVDQNASVGGSNEDLAGKVLALGQAWAKQKLQGEEILQLVERGVPVWDLLQKATGKNVAELQKLSEQGKLGRGVIKALYEEIGRANSGKANEALTGMSGLLAQIAARWVDFKQRIVDAGLGDYFKQQMQTLLQSTGGLDGLARRVSSAIVGTLEALKSLGQQLAIIAQPIANTAVAIARHADAVVLLGKVYVGLKLTQFASQFAGLAASMGTATAATGALTAAETARATGLGRLGGIMAKIPRVLTVTFAAIGLDVMLNGIDRLNEGLKARSEAIAASDRMQSASSQLQLEQLRLGQQLQDLYRNSADVAVQSGASVSAMTRAQAQDYQFALEQARQYFAGIIREARGAGDAQVEATATERWKALGAAVVAAKDRITDLARTASADTSLGKMADAAVLKFDALIAKTKSAKESVNDIFKGVDLTRADGLKQALDILDQVNARGTAAARAVKEELRTALAAVATEDLPKLKAAADEAFGSGSAGAKQFAAEVGRISLSRLGVDVEAIKTGFSEVGRAAVDNFRGAVGEIDKLGLSMEQRSTAIAQAFDNAFKQASTKAELGALKVALQDALSSGDVGFKEFQARIVETDAKLAELGGTGKQLGADVAEGAREASSSLRQVGDAASEAATATKAAGDVAAEAGDNMEFGSKKGKQFALSMYEVSDAAIAATMATNRLAGSTLWTGAINRVTDQINDQGDALRKQVADLQAASAEFDEMAGRRKQLAQQYNLLGAGEIEKLLQAESALEANRKRAAEQRLREVEQQAKAAEPAGTKPAEVAAVQIAQRAAAAAVTDVLASTQQAAAALSTAAATVRTAVAGEVVVRFINDPSNAPQIKISDAQMRDIAIEVVRRLRQAKGSTT